jgi:hypothetical protein
MSMHTTYQGRHRREPAHRGVRPSRGRAGVTRSFGVATAAVTLVAVQAPGATAETTYSAHWTLDEVGGSTAYDVSGNSNNGTSSHVVGDGSGYTFNGTDSRVVVPDSPGLSPGSADFSYGVTLKVPSAPPSGETYTLLSKGISTTKAGDYKLEIINSKGKAEARCAFDSILSTGKKVRASVMKSVQLANGKTHTVTCTKTSTSLAIAVDDLRVHTKSYAALGSVSNTSDLGIGAKAEPDSKSGYDWYRGELSDAWVLAASGSQPPPPPPPIDPGQRAHWTFDEVGSSTAVDVTGNGHDGVNHDIVGDGTSYTFNGTSSRVIVPAAGGLDPGFADFSYGVTLAMTGPPATGETFDVLRKGLVTNNAGDYKIEIVNSKGKAEARCVFNSFLANGKKVLASVMKSVDLANGSSHTVTCTKTSTSLAIAVDALPVHTKAYPALGSVSNAADLGIGAKAEDDPRSGYDWFEGRIFDAWLE